MENAKITVPNGNTDFNIKEVAGLRLITPTKTKHVWSDNPEELWLRSVIVDSNDRVVSIGFPKFKNLGESEIEGEKFAHALTSGEDIVFLEKMDGSLAIRSVIGGEVNFRTRGTFGDGDEYSVAIRKTAEKYPILLDPTFMPGHSLLFEYISPNHPVVIVYKESDLVLLGAVDHTDLSLMRYKDLASLAKKNDLTLVNMHTLPRDLDELAQAVTAYDDCEGVVVRFDNEQHYLKLKSAKYLAQHSLRFNFGAKRAMETCKEHDFATDSEFVDHLYKLGLDYEIAKTRLPFFHAYDRARTRTQRILDEAQAFVDTHGDMAFSQRKKYAAKVHENTDNPMVRAACFSLLDGHMEKIRTSVLKRNIEIAVKEMNLSLEEEEISV